MMSGKSCWPLLLNHAYSYFSWALSMIPSLLGIKGPFRDVDGFWQWTIQQGIFSMVFDWEVLWLFYCFL